MRQVHQFSSVAQSCPTLCNPMNHITPGLPVHHQLPEFTQTHVHRVSDAIQPSHPLSSPFLPALNPSQHQGLFQWVNSSHEVAKVLLRCKSLSMQILFKTLKTPPSSWVFTRKKICPGSNGLLVFCLYTLFRAAEIMYKLDVHDSLFSLYPPSHNVSKHIQEENNVQENYFL